MPFRLCLPPEVLQEIIEHAQTEKPLECCGLIAGVLQDVPEETGATGWIGRAVKHYPLINAAASPTTYLSEPRSMFEAMRAMRQQGVELLAVYHSHPTSAPIPSRTDLAQRYSEETACLIVSLVSDPPSVGVWWLFEDRYEKADWEVSGS